MPDTDVEESRRWLARPETALRTDGGEAVPQRNPKPIQHQTEGKREEVEKLN